MDVLIVEPVPSEVLVWLRDRHAVRVAPELARDPLAFRKALSGARAAIVPPWVSLDAAALWQAPHLRAVGRVSAGVENLDLEACARAGVEVIRAGAASASAEAEFVIGALLALKRRVPVLADDGLLVGRELGASTVGLIGLTPGAECLARLLRAFGAEVLGYDPGLHASDAAWRRAGIEPVPLAELMRDCDSVCVLLNHYARFDGLLGERMLGLSKPDQVIVSLTLSRIFDELALAHALTEGPLAGAWLDSVEPGALDPGRPLHRLERLQTTPCVASTTRESRLRAAWVVAERIDEVLRTAPARRVRPASPPAGPAGPAGVPEPA